MRIGARQGLWRSGLSVSLVSMALGLGACFSPVGDGQSEGVPPDEGANASLDSGAGVLDGGASADAGALRDAGLTADGGGAMDGGGPADAGPGSDARDAGRPLDGGGAADGGPASDAGPTQMDGGEAPDAGLAPDGGRSLDAGTPFDAGSPFDAGAPDPGAAVCAAFAGTWQRTDGFVFVFTANGCVMSGVGDTAQHTHRLQGTLDPATGHMPFTIARTTLFNGCITVMSGFMQVNDPTHLTLVITGTDGACDLPRTFTDVQSYQHL